MRVFVTGAGGFLGRALALHLAEHGHAVRASSRAPRPIEARSAIDVRQHAFGDPVPGELFASMDAVAHCAHDFARGAGERNERGTIALMHAAEMQGVKRQVFVSSLAAREDAVTEYGRSKFRIEAAFLERGHAVVRPGTILGPGGLFGRMAQSVLEKPITPLVDGGRGRMMVIGVPDLCAAIEALLLTKESGLYNLYLAEERDMREVLTMLGEIHGRRPRFVGVPSSLLMLVLRATESIGVRLPVDSDNLRGFRMSQSGIGPSRLEELIPKPHSLRDSLAESFARVDAPRGGK